MGSDPEAQEAVLGAAHRLLQELPVDAREALQAQVPAQVQPLVGLAADLEPEEFVEAATSVIASIQVDPPAAATPPPAAVAAQYASVTPPRAADVAAQHASMTPPPAVRLPPPSPGWTVLLPHAVADPAPPVAVAMGLPTSLLQGAQGTSKIGTSAS